MLVSWHDSSFNLYERTLPLSRIVDMVDNVDIVDMVDNVGIVDIIDVLSIHHVDNKIRLVEAYPCLWDVMCSFTYRKIPKNPIKELNSNVVCFSIEGFSYLLSALLVDDILKGLLVVFYC